MPRSMLDLLMQLCVALRVHWVVEQPASSQMFYRNRLYEFAVETHPLTRCRTVKTYVGMFGSASLKPTLLLGTPEWTASLHRPMRHHRLIKGPPTAVHSTTRAGKKNVTGARGLKRPQVYPVGYGEAFAALITSNSCAPLDPVPERNFPAKDTLRAFASCTH